MIVEFVCQQDTEQLNDTSEEKIGLGGQYEVLRLEMPRISFSELIERSTQVRRL